MSIDMLDRLGENKLRGLEEFIDSGKAAVDGCGEDQAAALADVLVDEGSGVRQSLLRLWDYHWSQALAREIPDPQEDRKNLRSLLDRGSQILARGAAAARVYADRSGRDVARLAPFEEQARAFPLWVEECMARLEMLDQPCKPLDLEMLAQTQAEYERGECEDVADIIARVKAGGPLVKE